MNRTNKFQLTRKSAIMAAVLTTAGVIAAEHFLVAFNMRAQDDADTEYASAQAFFGVAMPTLDPKGSWRPGDTFIVQYNDAKVSFTLSARGMVCSGLPYFASTTCRFASTVPFDTPPRVIEGTQSNGTNVPLVVAGDHTVNTFGPLPFIDLNAPPVFDLNAFTPTYTFTLTSGNTSWVNGVMTPIGSGAGSGSGGGSSYPYRVLSE